MKRARLPLRLDDPMAQRLVASGYLVRQLFYGIAAVILACAALYAASHGVDFSGLPKLFGALASLQ